MFSTDMLWWVYAQFLRFLSYSEIVSIPHFLSNPYHALTNCFLKYYDYIWTIITTVVTASLGRSPSAWKSGDSRLLIFSTTSFVIVWTSSSNSAASSKHCCLSSLSDIPEIQNITGDRTAFEYLNSFKDKLLTTPILKWA